MTRIDNPFLREGRGEPEGSLERDLLDLTRVAATLCGARQAALAIADAGVIHLWARVGVRIPSIEPDEALLSGRVLVIPDVASNGPVSPPASHFGGVRFFASAPLHSLAGEVVGALLVMDPAPRELSADQQAGLETLARQASRLIEPAFSKTAAAVAPTVQEDAESAERMRRLELLRREQEKLAAAGRIAARVAHEINNPLAGIKNAFQLVKDAVPEDHRYATYVPRIEQEIDRIAAIVRQMLELYQSEPDSSREFLATHVLREILDFLGPAAQQRRVRLGLTADDYVRVFLPAGSFRQIVYNLVQNAIDVSPEGGAVSVRAWVAEGVLTCTVSDQGPGIPGELQPHIFEPFFTTKPSRPGKSLGLGLPVCWALAEGLGGSLDFSSGPENGTTFRVILPLQRATGED